MAEAPVLVSPALVFARPTADQIWLGPTQQAALSQLSRPTRLQLLLGPPSSGKTTLLNRLAQTSSDAVVLFASGPKDDSAALLRSLLLSVDLAPWDLSAVEQRNLLAVFIHQRRSQGRRVLLAIDDAHRLHDDAWLEVERLIAFRADRKPALEVVLAGPPALADRLDPARTNLDAEIRRYDLPTPSPTDLVDYVAWRLSRFDGLEQISPVATQLLARMSGGRYAVLDVLCQMALLLARKSQLPRVDARLVRQAAATLVARRATKLETEQDVEDEPAPDARPQGYLLVGKNGKVMNRVMLTQRTLIGRSEHNDLCLPSPHLSRYHAVVVGTPSGYFVVDLNSSNGVMLNGRRVARASLRDQDVLTIGPFSLKLHIPEWIAYAEAAPEHDVLAATAALPSLFSQTSPTVRLIK